MAAGSASSATSTWKPSAETLVIPARGRHTATIVWLHGLGDSGRSWVDILPQLGLDHIKWLVPTAPLRAISISGGYPSTGWFDIKGLSAEAPEDAEGLDNAAAFVASLLEKELEGSKSAAAGPEGDPASWSVGTLKAFLKDNHVNPATMLEKAELVASARNLLKQRQFSSSGPVRLGVGGFSQGGALAMHTAVASALERPVAGKRIPHLAAAACLSGWLPGAKKLQKPAPGTPAAENAARLPIIFCHGTADMVVPATLGVLSAQIAKSSGFEKTEQKSYPGLGHSVAPEEMADLKAWALKHFPRSV